MGISLVNSRIALKSGWYLYRLPENHSIQEANTRLKYIQISKSVEEVLSGFFLAMTT